MKKFSKLQKKEKLTIVIIFLVLGLLTTLIQFSKNPIFRRKSLLANQNKTKSKITKTSIPKVALLSYGNLAKKFIQHIQIPLEKDKLKDVKNFIWGNKEFGYFKTNRLEFNTLGAYFEMIPATYKSSLNFCYQTKSGEIINLFSKKFRSQDISLLKNIKFEIEGKFDQPFTLIGAQFVPAKYSLTERTYLPVIVNKLGEIVWAHTPQNGKKYFRKYPIIRKTKAGEYGMLFGEKASFFELFNYRGEVLKSLDSKNIPDPFVIHHDFLYMGENRLITLGHKLHYLRNILPLEYDFLNWEQILQPPPKFLSTTVEAVDLSTKKNKVLWDPIDFFNPLDGVKWAPTKDFANKLLNNLPGNYFGLWGNNAHVDFSHANAIEYYPNIGFLLSLRNLSTVILLSEDFKKVLWSVGNGKENTFQTVDGKHAFYHQHHAQLLPGNHLLMMDNHTSPPAPNPIGTRVMVYKLEKATGKARAIWNYQPPHNYQVRNRGSAFVLKNTNILAFYPASFGGMDHLIEVDRLTGKAKGHMRIYFTDVKRRYSNKQLRQIKAKGLKPLPNVREGGGNRAVPIYTLGMEQTAEANLECKI